VSLQIVRFTALHDQTADVEGGIQRLFAAVSAAEPEQMQYLATRSASGLDFMLMLRLADGGPNPLPGIPEAAKFRRDLPGWTVAVPDPEPVSVLGNYRMLD
jgi:hypothetical protein